MRISKIEVESYGRLRDRVFPVSEGMTVFHGPNESGKTTLMEFIRNTLVPTNKREVYPERRKTDSGSVSTRDGKTVTLTQRTRGGDVPECISKLEPDLYRSIFALNRDDLDDGKLLDSGELGQRFLTIPGSDGMMEAMEKADKDTSTLLGKTSSSPSHLNAAEADLADVRTRIAELRRNADSYGTLSRELDELEARKETLRQGHSDELERRDLYTRYQSQKENYRQLAEAQKELSEIGRHAKVTPEGSANFNRLDNERAARKKVLDESGERLKQQRARLGGTDPALASDLDFRMAKAVEDHSLYTSRKSSPSSGSRTVTESRPNTLFLIAGAVLALIGLIGMVATPYTVVLAAVGVLVAVTGFVRKTEVVVSSAPAEDHSDYIRSYEREVVDLMTSLGRGHTTVDADVQTLKLIRSIMPQYREAEKAYTEANRAYSTADMEMMRFLLPFGGEQGFRQSLMLTNREEALERQVSNLRLAIRNSGLDPDKPECPVENVSVDTSEEEHISQRIGEVRQAMRNVLDTSELDALIDREASLQARIECILRRGAVSHLATVISEEACNDAYEDVHPGVISTADRYLAMMTDGRYRFDLDPRNKGLSIRDGDGVKGHKQWSTGLRAQVMLSIKLAVAKELGGGEVPMILDDVLLPFDTERKAGAVKALKEVSEEMQVLMFTCDDQTAELASECGTEVVNM